MPLKVSSVVRAWMKAHTPNTLLTFLARITAAQAHAPSNLTFLCRRSTDGDEQNIYWLSTLFSDRLSVPCTGDETSYLGVRRIYLQSSYRTFNGFLRIRIWNFVDRNSKTVRWIYFYLVLNTDRHCNHISIYHSPVRTACQCYNYVHARYPDFSYKKYLE